MAWEKLGTGSVTGAAANTSWKELARGTGSGGTTIDSGTFTAKDNIMVLGHITQGRVYLTYNGSTGNEYAHRRSEEGGSDSTQTSQDKLDMSRNLGEDVFFVGNAVNVANQEKLGIYNTCSQNSAGAGNAPKRQEWVTKYVPSSLSTNITSVKITTDSGTYDSNDQIVVLGYDNDEADSGTNFWQELASVSGTGSSTSLSSGTFAAKKYLKFRLWANNTAAMGFQCNGDTGSNYARRYNYTGGGGDGTTTSGSSINVPNNHTNMLTEGYIVNNSSTEKLVIFNTVDTSTAGAGTAPDRSENVGKWTNTSDQITSMVWSKGGNFDSNAQLTIWGAD